MATSTAQLACGGVGECRAVDRIGCETKRPSSTRPVEEHVLPDSILPDSAEAVRRTYTQAHERQVKTSDGRLRIKPKQAGAEPAGDKARAAIVKDEGTAAAELGATCGAAERGNVTASFQSPFPRLRVTKEKH
jgi:hypothetical protein